MQFYTDRTRRHDPHALPDAEVFYVTAPYHSESKSLRYIGEMDASVPASDYAEAGFYWWPCFPGCLPDSEPIGPFPNIFRAVRDARRF